MPNEDLAEIERRTDSLYREMKPKTELAKMLVRRVGFLGFRLERCERYDIAMQSKKVRHAEAAFTEERLAELNIAAARLHEDPDISVRKLRSDPDGIGWLLERWDELRQDLVVQDGESWSFDHLAQFEDLLGRRLNRIRITRNRGLMEAVRGFYANLDPAEVEGLSDPEKTAWAHRELLTLIDREIADLKAALQSFDLTNLRQDRDEADDRALFDASKEAVLARKYEAATERAFYRALRELGEVNEIEPEPEIEDPIEPEVDLGPPAEPEVEAKRDARPRGKLASYFQTALAPVEIDEPRPVFAKETEIHPTSDRPSVAPDAFSPDFE